MRNDKKNEWKCPVLSSSWPKLPLILCFGNQSFEHIELNPKAKFMGNVVFYHESIEKMEKYEM